MVSSVLGLRHVLLLNFCRVCAVRVKTELVVCFGELLIDFVPTVGGLSLADAPAFKKAPGGAPANVAVGIAKLGGNAAFVGKVNCLTDYKY
jgi:fructokinase